ncbi:hypothetical protein HPB51_005414 [Rhipicephalus microplus]|uniref:Uncharacterized protein n=1 Tax=Rhipicephalus microplus TaxID=6941 RepID=A0A9J6E098_RHIMP|nr:hypothetical protein HPB51_005414 [Rhipicephalus microplus]
MGRREHHDTGGGLSARPYHRASRTKRQRCRLILLYAGSEDGFLNSACLLFRAAKRSGDYHTEMDLPRFEKWFVEQLLPNIKPCSVIVMDKRPPRESSNIVVSKG